MFGNGWPLWGLFLGTKRRWNEVKILLETETKRLIERETCRTF